MPRGCHQYCGWGHRCPCRQGRAQALRDTWVSLQSPLSDPCAVSGEPPRCRGAPVSVCPSGAPTLLAYQRAHPRAKGPSAAVRAPFNQWGGGRDQSIPWPGHPSRDAAPGPNPAPGWMWLRRPASCFNHTIIWGWRQARTHACTHLHSTTSARVGRVPTGASGLGTNGKVGSGTLPRAAHPAPALRQARGSSPSPSEPKQAPACPFDS